MNAQYEITSGYVGSMGQSWKIITGDDLEGALNSAAEYNKMSREQLEKLLNDGRRLAAETGNKSPNYQYDHGMAMIRSTNRTAPKIELVKCSCGHSVPRGSVMTASMGNSCPDCYDRRSE